MSNKKLVSFRLPDDLMQDLRTQANHNGISVTELVSRLLRQGLYHREDDKQNEEEQVNALVDRRIASLEEKLQDLKMSKQPTQSGTLTALQALLTQSIIDPDNIEIKSRLTQLEKMHESNLEMKTHITQIEQMVERLIAQAKA